MIISGVATEDLLLPSSFCQYGAQDFFKIDKKKIEVGVVTNLQRSRGRGQTFSIMPPTFITLATPLVVMADKLDSTKLSILHHCQYLMRNI